jgi:hypothetical protein
MIATISATIATISGKMATPSAEASKRAISKAFTEPMLKALKGTGEFLWNATLATVPTYYLWGVLALIIIWVAVWFWYNFIR